MPSILCTWPLLARAAPRLTRQLFTFRHCPAIRPKQSKATISALGRYKTFTTVAKSEVVNTSAVLSYSLPALSRTATAAKDGRKRFPDVSDRVVAYWLLGSAASVFGIVVFGGLTRLTESGLSITEWKPVTGSLPPQSAADWDAEFDKYRASPEFKLLNPHMSIDEFKKIYYMEWTHRIWGRVVGLSFLLPSVYFIARRRVSARMAAKLIGIAGLIGFQGFLGWWMVKSGLKDDLFASGSHPRVSQYRLTAHLGTAFLCYTAMLWNGLSILRTHKLLSDPQKGDSVIAQLKDPKLRFFRRSVGALAVLVFCTAMSGGLVAGLDAGLIYNDFPKMGLGWTPPKSELFSDFYSHVPDKTDLWWRNALENPSLVQLDHRILAMSTFTSVLGLWAYTKLSPTMKRYLPIAARKGMHGVVGFVCLQVVLGISTLLYLVPMPLASAHQAGSLALLSSVIVLGSRSWVPGRAARLVAQRLANKSPASTIRIVNEKKYDSILKYSKPRSNPSETPLSAFLLPRRQL